MSSFKNTMFQSWVKEMILTTVYHRLPPPIKLLPLQSFDDEEEEEKEGLFGGLVETT